MNSEVFDINTLSKAFIGIRGRAERLNEQTIVDSFASVGPLEHVIANEDHQIIYGRRGTGKTHALRFLSNKVADEGGISFFLDMTTLGSDISIYNDPGLKVSERATRLLIDVQSAISDSVQEFVTSPDNTFTDTQLSDLMKILDEMADATSRIRVEGELSLETISSEESGKGASAGLELGLRGANLSASADYAHSRSHNVTQKEVGKEVPNPRFPELSGSTRKLCDFFSPSRIWILLDEWSSLPLEIQPFLADMLRRVFFNIHNVSVKIAAIEHRTKFCYFKENGDYVGLEPTADIKANLKLDDYLLFDNDHERPVEFFKEFLFKHVVGVCKERDWPAPSKPNDIITIGFSQKNAFSEFVKATEGVPRDAINIISASAQKSFGSSIDIPTIRQTSHRYYLEDKSSQVDESPILRDLLKFIIDDAIRNKKTNSFLVPVDQQDRHVDMLFDRRLIHIRSRNVSSRDNPGARYFHYKLDYGCYIDLISTRQMPSEFEFSGKTSVEDIAAQIEVPEDDDGRSYRRSILDLEKFYEGGDS